MLKTFSVFRRTFRSEVNGMTSISARMGSSLITADSSEFGSISVRRLFRSHIQSFDSRGCSCMCERRSTRKERKIKMRKSCESESKNSEKRNMKMNSTYVFERWHRNRKDIHRLRLRCSKETCRKCFGPSMLADVLLVVQRFSNAGPSVAHRRRSGRSLDYKLNQNENISHSKFS